MRHYGMPRRSTTRSNGKIYLGSTKGEQPYVGQYLNKVLITAEDQAKRMVMNMYRQR